MESVVGHAARCRSAAYETSQESKQTESEAARLNDCLNIGRDIRRRMMIGSFASSGERWTCAFEAGSVFKSRTERDHVARPVWRRDAKEPAHLGGSGRGRP